VLDRRLERYPKDKESSPRRKPCGHEWRHGGEDGNGLPTLRVCRWCTVEERWIGTRWKHIRGDAMKKRPRK
jgi:hypothetical protein